MQYSIIPYDEKASEAFCEIIKDLSNRTDYNKTFLQAIPEILEKFSSNNYGFFIIKEKEEGKSLEFIIREFPKEFTTLLN